MPPLRARSLTHEYRLHASAAVLAVLAAIECSPDIADAALAPVDITVDCADGFLSLNLPDGHRIRATAQQAVNEWRRFALRQIGASHPGHAFLPAASIIGPQGRFLLIGDQRCGRTTLALHMLMRGYQVEGDEHALIDWGGIIMRPSRMFAAPDLARLVPAAGELFVKAPKQYGWSGQETAAIDPSLPGRPWRIQKGPVAGLIVLELNSGGRSVLGRLSPDNMFARLMALALMPDEGVALAVARLRALVMAVPAGLLSLGDLDGAAWHIERATAALRC
ncbi:hypothetical protein E8L99_19630 [Phreatobacter aquaticus]|uniref:Uncharacterized protein n=1 Tax=Phreatobacter aquaticus TaxID=2570229 RepID=A0A4D7QS72_9HYPH|nr:hypothetical protein [Phreatobacter aquaticus]QCK87807.1 hypothetical protein E8L99_19630 [Phreatobacter aquaticus]